MTNATVKSSKNNSSKITQYQQEAKAFAEAKKVGDAAALAAMKQWQSEKPAERGHIRLKTNCVAYKPAAVPFNKIIPVLIDKLLFPRVEGLKKTQREILAEVQLEFPNAKLNPNLWNKPLLPSARNKAQMWIDGNAEKPISIRNCKTLAEVRKLLIAKGQSKEEARTFKATFTFTKDRLIVGKKVHAYIPRPSGKNTYFFVHLPVKSGAGAKRSWVRIAALAQLVKDD